MTGVVCKDRTAVEKKVIVITMKMPCQIVGANGLDCIQQWTLYAALLLSWFHLHANRDLNVAEFRKVEGSIQSFADT